MKRITSVIEVDRDADRAWRLVSDLSRYDEVMVGTAKWEPLGGDRYRVMIQVGAVPTGGEVTVTVDHEAREVGWEAVRGTGHQARLRVQPLPDDRSRLVFELTFALAGPAAALTELVAGPIVRRNLEASLESARHLIEFDMDRPS
jgi:uncharacterized membrane protein